MKHVYLLCAAALLAFPAQAETRPASPAGPQTVSAGTLVNDYAATAGLKRLGEKCGYLKGQQLQQYNTQLDGVRRHLGSMLGQTDATVQGWAKQGERKIAQKFKCDDRGRQAVAAGYERVVMMNKLLPHAKKVAKAE